MLTAVGTKVEVLASTAKKKGAKPRVGSQGYCVTSEKMQHIAGTNVVFTPASIIFTRFGYQDRRRSELKNVCLVYPKDQRSIKNIKPYLNKILKNTKDHSIIRMSMRQVLNKQKVPMPDLMVVRPVTTSETILNSENEFNSWLSCIFHSRRVRNIFTTPYKNEKGLVSQNFLKELPCTLADLLEAMNNKRKFTELAKFFFENPKYSAILRRNIAGLNQYFRQETITDAIHSLTVPWKSDYNVVSAALVLGSSERHLTPDENQKFKVRLSPSTYRAYKAAWHWLDVIKTL